MTPNLTHLALHVRDLEACVAFYREFCAMEIVHERGDQGQRIVWLAEPGRGEEFIFVLLPGGPVCPTRRAGRFLSPAASRRLAVLAPRRNALLTGDKNRRGEMDQYRGSLV